MDILGHAVYPLKLSFKNKQSEREYTKYIELETRVFIRVGILLSRGVKKVNSLLTPK